MHNDTERAGEEREEMILEQPTEYVCEGHEFRWQHPTDESSPIGIITFSEIDGPELPAGWVYWVLGKVGSACSYEDAKRHVESAVARGKPSGYDAGSYLARVVEQIESAMNRGKKC